ncbi:tRNA lysidine(34) synthetase TilS [Photobacterium atrarenae]|uniref:tRNA(Ile)-lysidine synthase n=1 Tax=Photobacterium atrarenae TaxID=865757 RepID=A0ABY5GI82_9GAMM|nr:tRNA lysidine(34) synthetase TilS [Photobacterium atrarenae]UTV28287.1 tRNA lysidine(34) synthetase TilS [Photobacterium atrarenae]
MLYSRLTAFLQPYCQRPRRFVLALSGGLDSRVLLDLMGQFIRQHPLHQCQVVHVHHGLSPNADTWLTRCRDWSAQAGLAFAAEHVTVQQGTRLSVEQQAREQRYQALARHVQSGDLLLTAQHADDQLETFLLALKRGSGPAGLAAMAPESSFGEGVHLRPLLSTTRAEMETYADAKGLAWVEDESNRNTRYDRNFLRHEITPALVARWPGVRKSVARSAALCGEQEALLEELLADRLAQAVQADGSLAIAKLGSERTGKQLIRLWLRQQDVLMPTQAQLAQIWHSVVQARADANPQLRWHTVEVRRHRQHLYLIRQWPDIRHWQQPCVLGTPCALPQGLGTVLLQQTAQGQLRLPAPDEPVSVRFNPEGIEARPVGRVGRRKLKKLFQEYGVPSWNRRRTPLIFYGEQLAAVAGLFVVEGFHGQDCDLTWHNDVFHVQC